MCAAPASMSPLVRIPRPRARTSAAWASLPREHGLRELSMGTSQDYRVAAEEGATYVRVGSTIFGWLANCSEQDRLPTAVTFRVAMGFADVRNKTLVYFGIAEEEEWDEDGYLTDEELQRAYAERPNVRRLRRAARAVRTSTTGPTRNRRPAAHERPRRRRHASGAPAASWRREPAVGRRACRRCTSSCRAASTTPSRSPTASRKASR